MAATMVEAFAKALTPGEHSSCRLPRKTTNRKDKVKKMEAPKTHRDPLDIEDEIARLQRQIKRLEAEKDNAKPKAERFDCTVAIRGLAEETLIIPRERFDYFVRHGGLRAMRDAGPGGAETN